MSGFLSLMARPFIACLVLTGMHAYLGLHVIERQVIFVDLALAQLAALGATIGVLAGFGAQSSAPYILALGFAFSGAVIFSLTRSRTPIVPQEALIGIVYAVSAAASILVLSRAAEGGEKLTAILVGHLLFVRWSEIAKALVLYSAIGAVHFIARKPLTAISCDPEGAFSGKLRVRLWDLLFYASFALVVTSSVEMAGVLLVFSFLIVPAVCGMLLAGSLRNRLLVGWAAGLATSIAGIAASYLLDLPTGATVVCAFGVCLVVCALARDTLLKTGYFYRG